MVIHVGTSIPYSLHARRRFAIGFQTPEAYRWIGTEDQVQALEMASSRPVGGHAGRDAALDKIREVLRDAQASSAKVREAATQYKAKAEYPRNPLSGSLNTVAALLAGGLKTRVFSVEMSGFDTHVNQRGTHDNLMSQLSDSLAAFVQDLEAQGLGDRVTILAFSEFGRRARRERQRRHRPRRRRPDVRDRRRSSRAASYGDLPEPHRARRTATSRTRSTSAAPTRPCIDRWLGGRHADVLGKRFERVAFLR